ncbi:OmpA family protein [Sinobacterium caligoides]|uniref:OmpA family protein n=1 Tax=Sinobacterium caligoides TaxID=933926 RepID=A0A3N2DMR9_9GAMM|nr:OmpA family protein [Sinobacterium caligoides]ROS00959.1 OmpA family protein [Sinobacterium caligoides]
MSSKLLLGLSLFLLASCAEHIVPEDYQPAEDYGVRGLPNSDQPIRRPYSVGKILPPQNALADDDSDGVINGRDQCANTSMSVQITNNGCDLFDHTLYQAKYSANFNTAQASLSTSDAKRLKSVAEEFNDSSSQFILVVGHTDASGHSASNQTLSIKRAVAIAEVLHNRYHVPRQQILISGQGNKMNIATNDTEADRAKNRRADVLFTDHKNLERFKWDIWSVDNQSLYDTSVDSDQQQYNVITFDEAAQ